MLASVSNLSKKVYLFQTDLVASYHLFVEQDEGFQTGQMTPVQLCYISFPLLLHRQFSGTHSHILFPFPHYSQQNLSLSISNSAMQCCRFRKCLAVFTAKSSRSRAGNSRNTSSEGKKQLLLSYCFPFHFTHSKSSGDHPVGALKYRFQDTFLSQKGKPDLLLTLYCYSVSLFLLVLYFLFLYFTLSFSVLFRSPSQFCMQQLESSVPLTQCATLRDFTKGDILQQEPAIPYESEK